MPHNSALHQYIEKKEWATAYKIACLGATFEDWQELGESALLDLSMEVARQSLLRTQDVMLLNHVHRMETLLKSGLHSNILKAEVLAYQVRPSGVCGARRSLRTRLASARSPVIVFIYYLKVGAFCHPTRS